MAQTVKNAPAMEETRVQSLGQEDPLEKEMATHASTVAWKIPWTEEPGGLQSMGSQSRIQLSDFALTFKESLKSFTVKDTGSETFNRQARLSEDSDTKTLA